MPFQVLEFSKVILEKIALVYFLQTYLSRWSLTCFHIFINQWSCCILDSRFLLSSWRGLVFKPQTYGAVHWNRTQTMSHVGGDTPCINLYCCLSLYSLVSYFGNSLYGNTMCLDFLYLLGLWFKELLFFSWKDRMVLLVTAMRFPVQVMLPIRKGYLPRNIVVIVKALSQLCLRTTIWIVFLHSGLSWAKCSGRLHFFRSGHKAL